MDMRILLKNYTVLAIAAGIVLGLIVGLLLGNLPLGVILMVGILLGAVALLHELDLDPLGLGPRSEVSPTPPAVRAEPVRTASPAPAEPVSAPPPGERTSGEVQAAPAEPAVREEGTPEKAPEKTSEKTIVLIAGTGQQASEKAEAKDLYTNPLVNLSLQYALSRRPDDIFILSGKHYLVKPDEVVEPYDAYLSTMKADELKSWSDEVLRRLSEVSDLQRDKFIILAAGKYRKHLLEEIANYELPTEGLSLTEQRDFLKEKAEAGAD
jgi:hypothetical protein